MKLMADAMTDITLDGRETVADDQAVDRRTNVSQPITHLQGGYTGEEAVSRDLDELVCLIADPSHRNGPGTVTVEALVEGTHVDLDDIALLQEPLLGRDPVDDFVVDGDARAGRKPAVPEEGGLSARLLDVLPHEAVELIGTDAGSDVVTGDKQCLTRDASGFLHDLDLIGIFELDHETKPRSDGISQRT